MKYSVVDLFAGAGGLSLGFLQTRKFEIKAAVENNCNAKKTYSYNHPDADIYDDVCKNDIYQEILKKHGEIDVVIGGPPCQGFSNANRQKNHAVSKNNKLVKQYIRAITELKPKAFIMENVSMLKSETHRFYVSHDEKDTIELYDIPTTRDKIELLPQEYYFADSENIICDPDKVAKYLWDADSYLLANTLFKKKLQYDKIGSTLKKNSRKFSILAKKLQCNQNIDDVIYQGDARLGAALESCLSENASIATLVQCLIQPVQNQRMLGKAQEIIENNLIVEEYKHENGLCAVVMSYAVLDYLKKILTSDQYAYAIDCDVLGAADFGAPQKRKRFVVIGVKRSISEYVCLPRRIYRIDQYRTVHDAISDLQELVPYYDVSEDQNGMPINATPLNLSPLGIQLRDSKTLYNHIITRTRETALDRFKALKQGENFHDLESSLKESTYSNIDRTQNTVYLRLKYSEPSGTVINVRKSMWIHPEKNRAISVREAARLQTFPDSFVFMGTKDSQYQQVGNAVPPIMAKAIAEKVADLLDS